MLFQSSNEFELKIFFLSDCLQMLELPSMFFLTGDMYLSTLYLWYRTTCDTGAGRILNLEIRCRRFG